jgi:bifunctional DNA-binding transcriptional regulator/antitoxin component of YhaV-PrlF toxin-antitoxin module
MLSYVKAAKPQHSINAGLPETAPRRASSERAPRAQYVAVQSRGTIALPAGLRRRLHLDEPGAQVAIVEREDGVIELRPALPVAADQRWFWTERWQAMEREVDAHLEAGRVTVSDGPDDFFGDLDARLER